MQHPKRRAYWRVVKVNFRGRKRPLLSFLFTTCPSFITVMVTRFTLPGSARRSTSGTLPNFGGSSVLLVVFVFVLEDSVRVLRRWKYSRHN